MIAGLGGFAWFLNTGGAAGTVISNLGGSQMLLPVALCGMAGFGLLLSTAYFSMSAPSVVGVKSPFSSRLVMSGESVDEKMVQKISRAPEKAMYENMCCSYASAQRNREAIIEKMGSKTPRHQQFLGVGLTLTIVSTVTIMAVITSGA